MKKKDKQNLVHTWVLMIVLYVVWVIPVPHTIGYALGNLIQFILLMICALQIGYYGWTPNRLLDKTIE